MVLVNQTRLEIKAGKNKYMGKQARALFKDIKHRFLKRRKDGNDVADFKARTNTHRSESAILTL